jgi:hypothetical protein
MRRLVSLWVLVALFTIQSAVAATSAVSGLQSPEQFLGYEIGTRFTYHHRMVAYFEYVAANSDLVSLEYYGESYEGRPLLVAYVSAAANQRNLDEIRVNNLRRAGLAEGTYTDDGKAILWMSYGIHGNESVSMEAALLTLFDLADPSNAETKAWLENTVVVIDPALNPDGREKYTVWYNQTVGRNFDPSTASRERNEPWPNGRANHYAFDMNRDWAWQTQQETRLRNVMYQKWLPHVHADFHEMGGDRYYFAPAANPYHEAVTSWQREFQTTIGQNHARHFDKDNRLYFTREIFDLFYPSYGDTWPTYQGAVGMTYEQSGSWYAGLGVLTVEGDTLTLAKRLSNQHLVGNSTVEAVAAHHARVAREFRNYYQTSINNPPTTYKSYILRHDGNLDNLRAMLALLDAQKITYGVAPARRNLRGFNFMTGQTETFSTTDQDIVISMYQPKSMLANVLLEPRTTIVDSLTYDITAWSLPYVYGVQAFATTERLNPAGDAANILNVMQIQGFPDQIYAWLFPYRSFDDARFLAALHRHGVRVRIAGKPFAMESQQFPAGTIVVTRNGNTNLGQDFDMLMRRLSTEYNRLPVLTSTGLMTTGIDLGSEQVQFAKAPRVMTVSGPSVSSLAFGEIWHFFDEQLEYPLTIVNEDRVGRINFNDFDVIVLPQGRYSDLFDGATYERLNDWLYRGGRLIAMEGVLSQLSGKRGFDDLKSKELEKDESMNARLRVFGDRERESMTTGLAGAIYRVSLDNTHPLAFGYGKTYYSLKRSTSAYEYLKNGWNVGHVPAGGFTSGFAGYRVKTHLEETLNMGVIPRGNGAVILFNDNPLFRGFWYNGKLLFSNAVFQPM